MMEIFHLPRKDLNRHLLKSPTTEEEYDEGIIVQKETPSATDSSVLTHCTVQSLENESRMSLQDEAASSWSTKPPKTSNKMARRSSYSVKATKCDDGNPTRRSSLSSCSSRKQHKSVDKLNRVSSKRDVLSSSWHGRTPQTSTSAQPRHNSLTRSHSHRELNHMKRRSEQTTIDLFSMEQQKTQSISNSTTDLNRHGYKNVDVEALLDTIFNLLDDENRTNDIVHEYLSIKEKQFSRRYSNKSDSSKKVSGKKQYKNSDSEQNQPKGPSETDKPSCKEEIKKKSKKNSHQPKKDDQEQGKKKHRENKSNSAKKDKDGHADHDKHPAPKRGTATPQKSRPSYPSCGEEKSLIARVPHSPSINEEEGNDLKNESYLQLEFSHELFSL